MAKKATARKVDKAPPLVVVAPEQKHDTYDIVRKQVPREIFNNLASALQGDQQKQAKMFYAMVDSWPRLSGNLRDMADSVTENIVVKPHIVADATAPSPDAVAKQKLVEDAITSMRGDMGRNEMDFADLVKDIVFGYYASPYVAELYWAQGENMLAPYAAKAVPPNYYGYPTGGGDQRVADHLVMFRDGHSIKGEPFPEHKFIIATSKSSPNHPALSSPLRVLTSYWMAATYGLEWLMQYCQLFGIPFRWAEVSNPNDMAAVNNMLQSIGSSGSGAFPTGTQIHFEANPASGSMLPQATMRDLADKQCDIFVRGETLTTDEGNSGSRSLGEVHERGKLKRKQSVSRYAAKVINRQYVPSLVELNFGDAENQPAVCFPIPDPAGDMAKIDRMGKIIKMGVDVTKERVYEEIGEDQPEPDEELFQSNIPEPVGLPGAPPSGKVTDKEKRPAEKPRQRAAAMRRVQAAKDTAAIDQLVDNTLRELTGLQASWLSGVRPFFERLVAKGQDTTLSEEDFAAALTQASKQLPDQFDRLDTKALADALEAAKMSATVLGAERRLTEFDRDG